MNKIRIRSKRTALFVVCLSGLMLAHSQNVTIDGLKFFLYPDSHKAVIDNGNTWSGELALPPEISYDGELYTVNGIAFAAFQNCTELTKVMIPKTIDHVVHHILTDNPHFTRAVSPDCMNPFVGCTALESIEVNEENPIMKSMGGVLFSKDGTRLYCYPAGIKAEKYVVPWEVTWIGNSVFAYNKYVVSVELPVTVNYLAGADFAYCKKLEKVYLPENLTQIGAGMFMGCSNLKSIEIPTGVTHIGEQAFLDCSSLKMIDLPESVHYIGSFAFFGCMLDTLVIRGQLDSQSVQMYLFDGLMESAVVFTLPMQIESFKNLFAGIVQSLEDYFKDFQNTDNIKFPVRPNHGIASTTYSLEGRRLTQQPRKGVYIRDGRKVVVK